jgi:hypothetical protein
MNYEEYYYEQYNLEEDVRFLVDKDAKDSSYRSYLDQLDCDVSWSRQNTEKTYDEIIDFLKHETNIHTAFIMRKGIHTRDPEYYFEVGLSNISGDISYFTHHFISVEVAEELIKKYKLKRK